ncbi:MAG TPA: hypothetical protein DEA96_10265, partial [Leptospiraceae bacterium]|nr:hypothetical protein [Leptospiraceae bacterium]
MNADLIFSAANYLAMLGWLILVLHYIARETLSFLKKPVEQAWIPVLLSILYTIVMGLTLAGILPG